MPTTKNRNTRDGAQPLLTTALLLAGLGNLILPSVLQDLLPVEYLLVTLGLCGIAILYQLRMVLSRVGMWWPGLAFVISCIPGFLVSPVTAYGLTKAQALGLTLVIFLTCAAIKRPPEFVVRFSTAAMIIGAVFIVAAQRFGTSDVGGRLTFLGLNPIGIGRVAGLVLVLALTLVIARRVRAPLLVLGLIALAAVAAVGVVATGSRGPLLAAAIALFGLFVFLAATKQLAPRVVVLVSLVTLAAGGAVLLSDSTGLTRLTTATDSGRSSLYEESFRLAVENPMGIGWGQLGQYIVDFRAVDEEGLYAHNVFLEIFVEGGVLALVAFTALTVACLIRAWRATRVDPRFIMVLIAFVYAVASAQFSSDIVGNRLMWLYMGFTLMSGWYAAHETANKEQTLVEQTADGPTRDSKPGQLRSTL